MEDLASTGEGVGTELYTRCVMSLLTVAWIILLITVSGVQQQTWLLVAIGSLGMVHTVLVAGQPRRPSAFGIHLTYREYILGDKAMESLKLLEEKYPKIGLSLLSTFFPGELRGRDEIDYWLGMQLYSSQCNHPAQSPPRLNYCNSVSNLHSISMSVDYHPCTEPVASCGAQRLYNGMIVMGIRLIALLPQIEQRLNFAIWRCRSRLCEIRNVAQRYTWHVSMRTVWVNLEGRQLHAGPELICQDGSSGRGHIHVLVIIY